MATRDPLEKLRQEIHRRLYNGIARATDAGAERYREAVSVPVEFSMTTKGLRARRSKPGEFPRMETGQGLENISSETYVNEKGVYGGFGVMGPQSGIGPYARTESDIPGHFEAGGRHLADLAGAPDIGGNWSSFGDRTRRKGPVDVLMENIGHLRQEFMIGAAQKELEVPF